MEQQIKQVPYGVADFANVMEQNLYDVDKTMFIPGNSNGCRKCKYHRN